MYGYESLPATQICIFWLTRSDFYAKICQLDILEPRIQNVIPVSPSSVASPKFLGGKLGGDF